MATKKKASTLLWALLLACGLCAPASLQASHQTPEIRLSETLAELEVRTSQSDIVVPDRLGQSAVTAQNRAWVNYVPWWYDASGSTLAPKGLDLVEGGRLGGKIYDASKLDQLGSYLHKRGFKLRLDGDDVLPPHVGGGFDYGKKQIILRSDATEFEVWHELSHFLHYQKVGPEAYEALSRVQKEQFVFDLLENSKKRWYSFTPEQRQSAVEYIYRVGGIR